MKKKGNKKMPTPRTNSFITPSLHLCSALKFRLFVVNALGKEKTSLHRINYMKYIIDIKEAKM